ncbi:MAG: prepilin-type N-terminal cleavage/methylation domain-containing protein [Candidatus Krumholzibacteria bacterium]|nr:prepilin-type N-terminal cleavage/methylation domain-containing protein [Candidatus Krumholzibacteria bacterium]
MNNRSNRNRGFSLLEMMIALTVGALLIMISYNVLTSQKKAGEAQNQIVSAQQNASVSLETLMRDLRLAGTNIDDFDKQPIFVDAAPYQVIFNADVSSGSFGVPSMGKTQAVPLSSGAFYSPGDYPGENLGTRERYNNGAETIRYTFDRDANGLVNSSDRYTETQNPADYALMREENGTRIDMIAYGLRGRENYPDGQLPEPLFKYYGDFLSNGTIRLWGDTDNNGALSQAEIAAMTRVPQNQHGKIIEVAVNVEAESPNIEASYVGPHSTSGAERKYRSIVMTSKIRPRNVGTGSANLHACGNPPASPTGLSGSDTPRDAGESITLAFAKSTDETAGERDIDTYSLYRREEGQVEWTCINSIAPTGAASYAINDDVHSPGGGPVIDTPYYYMVTAWDCRPQESNPSNVVGPVRALPNGPQPPIIVSAFDTPCDAINEVSVVIRRSAEDLASGGNVRNYRLYRGSTKGGGILSKAYIGAITANGSEYYTFLDNSTNNVALNPPTAGSYYYYIARAVSLDTIPSIDSNEYGAVYFSGSISACQITDILDFPDDEGTALTVTWKRSPSETCFPNPITVYEVRRKSASDPSYLTVRTVPAIDSPSYSIVDDGLSRGTKYTYCVWTISLDASVPSNEEIGMPLRNTMIDPPENLQANDILCDASGAVSVTWEKSPQDVTGGGVTHYTVYRKTEVLDPEAVGEVEARKRDTYSFVDGPASNPTSPPVIGEYYYYFATAGDRANDRESGPSNEGYTMSDGEPGAPRITSAEDTPLDAGRSITVTFDRSADDGHCTSNVIIYKIYRETSKLGGFSTLVGTKTATGALSYVFYDDRTFSSSPPLDGIGYYYAVRASDGAKESVNSNIAGPAYSISQNPGSYIVFEDDFETNKSWSSGRIRTENDWQRGVPYVKSQTYGNSDPGTAHGGSNVYGNDLGAGASNGRYSNNVENYLRTPVLDCWGHSNVVIQFYRWLNVEGPAYDQAYVEVSNSGTSGPWTVVWQNPSAITDNAWVFVQLDISQWADQQENVVVRFRLKSDGQRGYAGWNIDDFVVRERPVAP